MGIGIFGNSSVDRSFLMAMLSAFGGAVQFLQPTLPTFKKRKNRKIGSSYMNQRQLRKRAAQGGLVRQESKLKQRRA